MTDNQRGARALVGRIHTGTEQGWVQAILVEGGRVTVVGSREEVLSHAPAEVVVQDVGVVVPGFVDSHMHALWLGRGASEFDVSEVPSVADMLAQLREYADSLEPGAWILGNGGYDEESVRERRLPTIEELDEAAGGRPLLLSRRAHDALTNSEALRRAGVDSTTPDPPGGHIQRGPGGAPTGLLLERSAASIVEEVVPAPSTEAAHGWLVEAYRQLRSVGITAISDPALSPSEISFFVSAYHAGLMSVRTTVFPLGTANVDPYALEAAVVATGIDECDPEVLRRGPVKIFLDGAGALGTALRKEPWPGTTSAGIQATPTDVLESYAQWAWAEGGGLGIHAVGPEAVRLAVEVLGKVSGGARWETGRVHLIHAYLEQDEAVMRKAADLGIGAALQPALYDVVRPEVTARLGPGADIVDASRWMAAGVLCGGGSDGPGCEFDPLEILPALEQSIGRDRAIRFFTSDAARIVKATAGTLLPGAPADYVELAGEWAVGTRAVRTKSVSALDDASLSA
ncbi:amidohydrolase [Microbacterium rhizomatis]|uniref:Amidohydrolase family protein n=1 Tax=Microbacterium rhizomatis TaxID=1631477 RepID=A0A5J5IYH0_9MICO|nr:amidohydrolase family protein [Microbacterium rhizomatis]KAA9106036.1 amidohydrolase family protein [Microbacterium rhizomatis]